MEEIFDNRIDERFFQISKGYRKQMEKEKCSNCGLNGHDSRICKGKVCFKLFGVNIVDHKSFKRSSISMGNLQSNHYAELNDDQDHVRYFSEPEGQLYYKRRRIKDGRQKAKPWTEEEHQKFLEGLEILGKGKWKALSESYVTTRTPAQIASHAQKFFIRQASSDKKTNRSSISDMPSNEFTLVRLQDSPLSVKTRTETPSQPIASSAVMPVKQTSEIPEQASTSSQIANRFSYACSNPVIPIAANRNIPNNVGIRFMLPVPVSIHGKSFQGMIYQRPDSASVPGNFRNFVAYAPILIRPSGISTPASAAQPARHGTFQTGSQIPIEEEPLDLNK